MSNPTAGADKSDAAGRFPQIYAAEGAIFDILEKDSGGSTIASYLSVVTLGSNTGALVRDFTTSRFQARGAGGTTYIEAGDPLGDDVGGTMDLGGWNGTQADLVTINGASVNVAGRLTEQTYRIPGIVRAAAQAFSAAPTGVIPLTNDPTGVREWEIDLIDLALTGASDDTVFARFSYDGGLSYKSGATDYAYYTTRAGAVSTIGADTEIGLFINMKRITGSVPKGRATIRIQCPLGTDAVVLEARGMLFDSTAATPFYYQCAGWGLGGYGRPTHLQLLVNAGKTLSALYRISNLRGYGET